MATPEAHHELGPSALKYVEICPGFRSNNETNEWAEEGTMLHSAVENEDLTGLNEEQRRCVRRCLDYVAPMVEGADIVLNEQRVVIRYGNV
tara:strand:+ start:1750 stop:2022 length:273 start_codon:yes stop_codon:yes gene_type:complete